MNNSQRLAKVKELIPDGIYFVQRGNDLHIGLGNQPLWELLNHRQKYRNIGAYSLMAECCRRQPPYLNDTAALETEIYGASQEIGLVYYDFFEEDNLDYDSSPPKRNYKK